MKLDKNGLINVEIFLTVAQENEILLSDKDQNHIRTRVAFNNKIKYEELIKDLALIIVNNTAGGETLSQKENVSQANFDNKNHFQWVLRSNNREILNAFKHSQGALTFHNLIRIKKKKLLPPNTFATRRLSQANCQNLNSSRRSSQIQRPNSAQENIQSPAVANLEQSPHLISSQQSVDDNGLSSVIGSFSPELQGVIAKIIGKKRLQKTGIQDWSKQISAASKKINIHKNIQNKIFIKAALSSEKIQQQKEKIRRYMKENQVDIMHLNEINSVFLDCDENRTGEITKKQFLMQIAEQNKQFPADFLFSLIYDLQINAEDTSEDAILSYENLRNIIEIYNNCPIFLKGDNNNSENFKSNMDTNKDMNIFNGNDIGQDRIDKLFQYVHARIEEKFKDFRQAFRNFDKNFDGGLNFKEFITGMESIGVKLKLTDYRLIFDAVDYNNEGEIGFSKFCLLNTDRKRDLQQYKQEYEKQQQQSQQLDQKSSLSSQQQRKKPPLPPLSVSGQSAGSNAHPLFGDGNIPKNKDMNNFTKDIQKTNQVQSYMQRRFLRSAHKDGFKTVEDLGDQHTFGKSLIRDHNMVAILTNSYQEELKRISIDDLRQQLAQKRHYQAKPTNAQKMREKITKGRMSSIGNNSNGLVNSKQFRSNSVSIPRSSSVGSGRRYQKNFILKGSNSFSQQKQDQQ